MKSTIRIAMTFIIAGAAFGSLAKVRGTDISCSQIRMADGRGPVYPPSGLRGLLPMTPDGRVYPPGSVGRHFPTTAPKDGGGPVYPPSGTR
jgi:hypothetical protein